jgi:hypothetical protein
MWPKVSREATLVAQTMLATSVAFVDALYAFLSTFEGELTNDENKTGGSEAWSLVCNIVHRMFEDIVVHRCLDCFACFKSGVKQQVATEYLWASLQTHRGMAERLRMNSETTHCDI